MRDIVYRPRAAEEIDAIADYTLAQYGMDQARAYLSDMRGQIEFAAEFPGIGGPTRGLPSDYRKLTTGQHRVIYRYSETEIIVVRVLHERQDVPDEIEEA